MASLVFALEGEPVVTECALHGVADEVEDACLRFEVGDASGDAGDAGELRVVGARLADVPGRPGLTEEPEVAITVSGIAGSGHDGAIDGELDGIGEVRRFLETAHRDVPMPIERFVQRRGPGAHGADEEQVWSPRSHHTAR